MFGSNLPLKHCAKCETKRVPEGGIYLVPTKWICATCWLKRINHEKTKQVQTKTNNH